MRPARICPHKDPERVQVTHWFAGRPDTRMCESCAEPIVEAFMRTADGCDLCHRKYPHEELTLVNGAQHHFVIHAALCDECHPEGADSPRVAI